MQCCARVSASKFQVLLSLIRNGSRDTTFGWFIQFSAGPARTVVADLTPESVVCNATQATSVRLHTLTTEETDNLVRDYDTRLYI